MAENKVKPQDTTKNQVAEESKPKAKRTAPKSKKGKTGNQVDFGVDGNEIKKAFKKVNGPEGSNIQTYLIIGLMVFFALIVYLTRSASTVEITSKRFEEMMVSHDVKEVVIVNEKNVEITLKEESLQNKKYRDELSERGPFPLTQGPHYRFQIISPESC